MGFCPGNLPCPNGRGPRRGVLLRKSPESNLLLAGWIESEAAAKKAGAPVRHDIDADYWKLFSAGFPRCSGVALGLDRLMMALFERSTVDAVLPFPME